MNKNDVKLIVIVLIIVLIFFIIKVYKNNDSMIANVYYEDKIIETINLNKNSEAVNTVNTSGEPVVFTSKAEETVVDDKTKEEGVEFIKSPIVGTFYSKSSPDAEPFVKEGDVVHKGDIVCIVEAMKLMNEITAEFDCEIVSVVCEDAQMVEYGQKLFKVKRV